MKITSVCEHTEREDFMRNMGLSILEMDIIHGEKYLEFISI